MKKVCYNDITNSIKRSKIMKEFENIRKIAEEFLQVDKALKLEEKPPKPKQMEYKEIDQEFVQYQHGGEKRKSHCSKCLLNDKRIFEIGTEPPTGLENHRFCHCKYETVNRFPVGVISKMGDLAPDVYLKNFGYLPDYYITKKEAQEVYGWVQGKNTIAGKAPGKMIGGDVFRNKPKQLPDKEGRVWYECDVDYVSGTRGTCSRLYYSNDVLMFYTDHFKDEVYFIN